MDDYLSALHLIEIKWILWLQGYEWLEFPMRFFTLIGSQGFFLLFLPAIYWSVNHRFGYQLGFLLLLTVSLNSVFKIAFHLPRPYWIDDRVRAFLHEDSFGIPSGHAQIAVAVFGLMGVFLKNRLTWVITLILIFIIGLSRIYLGVHFVSDVLLGWWIGAIVIFGFLIYASKFSRNFRSASLLRTIVIFFLMGGSFLLSGMAIFWIMTALGSVVPLTWIINVLKAFPNNPPIDPMNIENITISSGAFFGFAAGGWWLKNSTSYSAGGKIIRRLLRGLIGMAGIGLLYLISHPLESNSAYIFAVLKFVQFSIIGLWITALAPVLFLRWKLATDSIDILDE